MDPIIATLIEQALAKAAHGIPFPPDNPDAKARLLKSVVELAYALDHGVPAMETFRNVIKGKSRNIVALGLLSAWVLDKPATEVKACFNDAERFRQKAYDYLKEFTLREAGPSSRLAQDDPAGNNRSRTTGQLWARPALLALSGLLLGGLLGWIFFNKNTNPNHYERVVLLMPLNSAQYYKENQSLGLLRVFETNKDWHTYANIVPLDTENSPGMAWNLLKEEIELRGTRHFIATLSSAAMVLADSLRNHPDYRDMGVKLLAVAASTSGFQCEKDFLYRYYIRNDEQIPALYQHYRTLADTSAQAYLYYINDASGLDTKSALERQFAGQPGKLVSIPLTRTPRSIAFDPRGLQPGANIFISAHSGELQAFIDTANRQCRNCKIFGTTTLAAGNYAGMAELTKNNRVFVARPLSMKQEPGQNTISFLVGEGISSFLEAIRRTREQEGGFHHNWLQQTLRPGEVEAAPDSTDLKVLVYVDSL
jgi:hypothetical protein